MQGFEVLWLPGMDRAASPPDLVEKRLAAEGNNGKTRPGAATRSGNRELEWNDRRKEWNGAGLSTMDEGPFLAGPTLPTGHNWNGREWNKS